MRSWRRENRDTLAAISTFISQPLLRGFDVSFDRLHGLYPAFFRRGSDAANIVEMDAASARLFELHHGDVLRAMGYGEKPPDNGGSAGRSPIRF